MTVRVHCASESSSKQLMAMVHSLSQSCSNVLDNGLLTTGIVKLESSRIIATMPTTFNRLLQRKHCITNSPSGWYLSNARNQSVSHLAPGIILPRFGLFRSVLTCNKPKCQGGLSQLHASSMSGGSSTSADFVELKLTTLRAPEGRFQVLKWPTALLLSPPL